MYVCIKTAGREEVGDARENGSGICGPGEGLVTREMVTATVRWMGVPEA